jgi:hypothetical protein
MRFKYSKQHIEFLSAEFKKVGIPEVTRKFNEKFGLEKTNNQIKTALSNRKITCGRNTGELKKGISKLFTHSQVEYITEKYQLHQAKKVTELLNKTCNGTFTEAQIKAFVKNHGINCNRTGHFKKGQAPWNTGTKGVMKPNKTSFKKGDIPINHRPVGSERITKDGYREIKTAEPNKWELLHRHSWAKVHGKENMPENLRFKDNNKMNCDASNLEPVSNQEHMVLNMMGFNQTPEELRPTVLSIAKLDVKTSNLRKGVAA